MFDHLVYPQNKIVFNEVVLDRDGDSVCSFIIGIGYGIFGSLTKDDLDVASANDSKSVSVVVHYAKEEPSEQVDEEGRVFNAHYTEPFVQNQRRKCVAVWREKEYDITQVRKCYDVHGEFVGYRVYRSNE